VAAGATAGFLSSDEDDDMVVNERLVTSARLTREDVLMLVGLLEVGGTSSGGVMQGIEAHSSMGGKLAKFMQGALGPHCEGSQVSVSPEISGHILSCSGGRAEPEVALKAGDWLVASMPASDSVRTDDELEMSSGDTVFESMLMRSEKPKGPVLNISTGVEPSVDGLLIAVGRR